jgi:hypothetical protein
MAQFLRPIEHGAAGIGPWTDDGTGTTNIWQALDDNSTADYIEDLNGGNGSAEFKLASGNDPAIGTGHVLRFEIQGTGSGGPERCTINLLQGSGGSVIASLANQTSRGSWSGALSYTLDGPTEADNITDYTDLHITIVSSNLAGTEDMWCAWAELEVPDAATTETVNVDDSATLVEDVTTILKSFININDLSTITEDVTSRLKSFIDVNEDVKITEEVTSRLKSFIDVNDSSKLTELVSLTLSVAGLETIEIDDNISLVENITMLIKSYVDISNSLGIVDSVGITSVLQIKLDT